MCRRRSCDTEKMRWAPRARIGFTRRRFVDGGASLSRPCSVKTSRKAGRHALRERRVHERRVLMAVEHRRAGSRGDVGDTGGERRDETPARGGVLRRRRRREPIRPPMRPSHRDSTPRRPSTIAAALTNCVTNRSVPPGFRLRTTCRTVGPREGTTTQSTESPKRPTGSKRRECLTNLTGFTTLSRKQGSFGHSCIVLDTRPSGLVARLKSSCRMSFLA